MNTSLGKSGKPKASALGSEVASPGGREWGGGAPGGRGGVVVDRGNGTQMENGGKGDR